MLFVTTCALFSLFWSGVKCGSVHASGTIFPVSSPVNASLVSHTSSAGSVLGCARMCMKFGQPFYYEAGIQSCYCYTDQDTSVVPGATSQALYGYPTLSEIKYDDGNSILHPFPERIDCLELLKDGFQKDGEYVIRPVGGVNVKVWCNQESEAGGGWTMIQRRMDGSVDFNRGWNDYVNGFGNVFTEYWLGLESIRLLTATPSSLRIRMGTFGDQALNYGWAMYRTFGLQLDSLHNYSLVIDQHTGNCGDSMAYHNGSDFSTPDADHDESPSGSCAVGSKAGWWYRVCYNSNLNAPYHQQGPIDHPDPGVTWYHGWNHTYSLKSVGMEIKRN